MSEEEDGVGVTSRVQDGLAKETVTEKDKKIA